MEEVHLLDLLYSNLWHLYCALLYYKIHASIELNHFINLFSCHLITTRVQNKKTGLLAQHKVGLIEYWRDNNNLRYYFSLVEHCNLNMQNWLCIVDSFKDTNQCNTALLIKQNDESTSRAKASLGAKKVSWRRWYLALDEL